MLNIVCIHHYLLDYVIGAWGVITFNAVRVVRNVPHCLLGDGEGKMQLLRS